MNLSLPVIPEGAIPAGAIQDVPQVCDGGWASAFLSAGNTAVDSQLIRRFGVVAGHSLSVLLRPRLLFPLLRCVETGRGMGERPGRSVPRACRSALLDTGGTRCCGRLLCSPGAFQSRHSRGPWSLVDGPGVSPCRPGA